jgi:hypothetical protein
MNHGTDVVMLVDVVAVEITSVLLVEHQEWIGFEE